jgi:hypothetical protein
MPALSAVIQITMTIGPKPLPSPRPTPLLAEPRIGEWPSMVALICDTVVIVRGGPEIYLFHF